MSINFCGSFDFSDYMHRYDDYTIKWNDVLLRVVELHKINGSQCTREYSTTFGKKKVWSEFHSLNQIVFKAKLTMLNVEWM